MKKLNEQNIKEILKNIKDINSKNNIVETGTVNNIIINKELVSIILNIKYEKDLYSNIIKKCE